MGKLQAGVVPVTPFQQNCTILFDEDTKEGVVVDPGGDVDVIIQTVTENGITLKEIWLLGCMVRKPWKAAQLPENVFRKPGTLVMKSSR